MPPETVTVDYANPAALASSTIAGAPQWLTQADVLEAIGPQLSARSDTFTIRAYGESVNPVTGLATGRAWLEATVQRGTGFVDSSEDAALPTVSLKSPPTSSSGAGSTSSLSAGSHLKKSDYIYPHHEIDFQNLPARIKLRPLRRLRPRKRNQRQVQDRVLGAR